MALARGIHILYIYMYKRCSFQNIDVSIIM